VARTLPTLDAPPGTDPVCPHCETSVDRLLRVRLEERFGTAYAWMCPQCHKVLGVSHRKGFWMG
jgi:uncharacterized protein with PIN domain